MKKVLKMFGVGLILFSISCTTCEPVIKQVPIYKSPVNTCIYPGTKPVCSIDEDKTDYDNFGVLMDCLTEKEAYAKKVKNYITCLISFFDKENNG